MADDKRSRAPPSGQGDPKRPKITSYELARKPKEFGRTGRPVILRANYFKLLKLPTESPRLYEVEIIPYKVRLDRNKEPEKDDEGNEKWKLDEKVIIPPSRVTNRKVISALVELYGEDEFAGKLPAYDGNKLLYAQAEAKFEANGEASKEFVVKLRKEVYENNEVVVPKKRFHVRLTRPADNDINVEMLCLALKGLLRTVPQNAISALETVLKDRMSSRFTIIGQSFFNPSQQAVDLGGGVEVWAGFHQSLKATHQGALALNVDTAVTAFVKPQPVIDFVAGILRLSVDQLKQRLSRNELLTPTELQKVEKALKGLTVQVTHMGSRKRKIRAQRISRQPVREIMFDWVQHGARTGDQRGGQNRDQGGERGPQQALGEGAQQGAIEEPPKRISVYNYFKEHYRLELRFPQLPAFMSGKDLRVATPFEVCEIVKGHRVKKLTDLQTSKMIKEAARPPGQRRAQTERIVLENRYNDDPIVREWGLEVSPQMMRVEARVLPPPDLMYKNGQTVSRSPGKWNLTPPGRGPRQMFKSEPIQSWAVLNLASREPRDGVHPQRAFGIAQQLEREGNNFGLLLPPLRPEAIVTGDPRNIKPSIEQLKALRPRFVLVILPSGKIPLYPELKKACEVINEKEAGRGGLVTQCCSADKILKANQQYYANLVQKINTKTGGQNVSFADAILHAQPKLADGGTIFMGADVSHAGGHRADVPSVAAVVGSFNAPVPTLYQAEVSAQKPRQEIISNLFVEGRWDSAAGRYVQTPSGAVRNLLKAFYDRNGRPPQRIVFYRDGVSDGQFEHVLAEEVTAIKKACRSIDSNYNPPLTFIIVQKRHHTRFYPDNLRDGDKKGNIQAGTVVDRDVSHPSLFDFFLCSHEGIQGTNRPVHYYVVHDENNFSADEIQRLTNDLCYTYAACTRSISVAPPAYYADLAATRARLYMEQDWDQESVSLSSGEGGPEERWQSYVMPRVQDHLKKSMIFC